MDTCVIDSNFTQSEEDQSDVPSLPSAMVKSVSIIQYG